MKHKIEIAPNLAIVIDGERVIGSKPRGLFLTTEMIVSDEDLKRLADRCLEVISDRKTEQTETQTETQNSNLTFKTLEYCDICDHKGCEECVANALDEHCMPSQFKKQIEDECAKEYEELGLKELKELINADRKTEPQYDFGEYADRLWKIAYERGKREALKQTEPTISKMEQVDEPQTNPFVPPYDNCKTCKWWNDIIGGFGECFVDECEYEPKDEPQTERSE